MIKGVHFVRVKSKGPLPRWYVYAWRGGPRIKVVSSRGKPLLTTAEVQAILTARASQETTAAQQPAVLRTLIRTWRSQNAARPSSPEWDRLSPGTKKTWGSALDRIEERWGETPLAIWNDARMTAKVVEWRDSRAGTPRTADIGITVLKALLAFGRLRGLVAINVAAGIPALYRNGQRAEIIWTNDDIERFSAAAIELGRPHIVDGLRLAALTGLRRADLVSLKWSQVGEFAIQKLALKRSGGRRRRMTMPRIPALDALLRELKSRPAQAGVETVLVNSAGNSWSADGFGGSFNRIRDLANILYFDEISGDKIKKHLHDVRGTFCTKLLIDGDLSDAQAAEIMGWSPDRVGMIRKVYVDQSQVIIAMGQKLRRIKR